MDTDHAESTEKIRKTTEVIRDMREICVPRF